jgi:hypothetical protein
MSTVVDKSGATLEIIIENNFRVIRDGITQSNGSYDLSKANGFYHMECDLCSYVSCRSNDHQELLEFGHVHQRRHHKKENK